MPNYTLQRPSLAEVLRDKESVVVNSHAELMETLPSLRLEEQVLKITGGIIPEKYYLRDMPNANGNTKARRPNNVWYKHVNYLHLGTFHGKDEISREGEPFYRLRRAAYERLRRERREKSERDFESMLDYGCMSWRPDWGDRTTRVVPFVAAFKGLERFLEHFHSESPFEKSRIRAEYSPQQAEEEGAIVWYSLPSVSGHGRYVMSENGLHNVAVFREGMVAVMAMIWSSHNCGEKQNFITRFKDESGRKMLKAFCQHDVEAFFAFLAQHQERLRQGDSVDCVYDPLERTKATVPMYLNPFPIATPSELHDFRALYRNATIRRPKRDRQRGGFLRDSKGEIIYDEEKLLWEAEIEKIIVNRISDLGRDAMFIRQRVVKLPQLSSVSKD